MNGSQHQRATLALAAGLGLAAASVASRPLATAAAGAIFGLWSHPDRDCPAAKIDRQMGILGLVGAIIWTPYAYLVPHRSRVSHGPIIGTVGRLLYLAAVVAAPLYFLQQMAGVDAATAWLLERRPDLLYAAAGLALSDLLHWIMDR
jgi:uncharacterized metal-binding protein